MKCYNHNDRDAFGICRTCGKALCLECMKDNSDHVLCANNEKCVERNDLIEKYYKNTNVIYSAKSFAKIKVFGIFLCMFGLLSSILAFLSNKFNVMLFCIGIFLIIMGIANIKRSQEFIAVDDNDGTKTKSKFTTYLFIIVSLIAVAFILTLIM